MAGNPTDIFLDWDEVVRFATVAAVVWSAAWFIFRQQILLKDLIYKKFEEIKNDLLDKIEYHERHDDVRFDNMRKEFIDMRVILAKHYKNGNGK